MSRAFSVAAAALAILSAGALAQAPEFAAAPSPGITKAEHPGRADFEHYCAPCHGTGPGDDGSPMLPGTQALQDRYQGFMPAQLELRADLDVDVLKLFVRRGIGAMPGFRKGELSDEQIEAIAGYLAASAEANAGL